MLALIAEPHAQVLSRGPEKLEAIIVSAMNQRGAADKEPGAPRHTARQDSSV